LLRDFRSLGSGTSQRANARARIAQQIIKAQMNLLFLSGIEVPDPQQIIMDALDAMNVPVPNLSDFLPSHAEVPAPRIISPVEEPPEPPQDPVIPEADPSGDGEDDGGGIYYDGPGKVGDSYLD
jgi:hypothetical protein